MGASILVLCTNRHLTGVTVTFYRRFGRFTGFRDVQGDLARYALKRHGGGTRSRVGKVAEFQRSLLFDHLSAVSGVGSSPELATCETSQVLLAGVSG